MKEQMSRGPAGGCQPESTISRHLTLQVAVTGPGWYEFDLKTLVQTWIRNPGSNAGVSLRDATGYIAGNPDGRDFHSSQHADETLRPSLVITYNPLTPRADAGADIQKLDWVPGSPVALDGSGSMQGAGEVYHWEIVSKAYGSNVTSAAISPNHATNALTPDFTPDVAGEYVLQLTVTNPLGYSATDQMKLRALSIGAHPRLYLSPERLAFLRSKMLSNTADWVRLKTYADGSGASDMHTQALMYQVTGNASYGTAGVTNLFNFMASHATIPTGGSGGSNASTVAVGYDWLYPLLTADQKSQVISYLTTQVNGQLSIGLTGWNNMGGNMPWRIGFAGLATYGDNPNAQAWMDHARYDRFQNLILEGLKINGKGGGWVEGNGYEFTATRIFAYVDGVYTATGERLMDSHPWFKDYLTYSLFSQYPKKKSRYGNDYYDAVQLGDMERNRESFYSYRRLITEMALKFYPGTPEAKRAQWYLNNTVRAASSSFAWEEFLHLNPSHPEEKPSQLAYHAEGLGRVFMRSDFNSENSTYITFFAGDHFTYHQDIAQGAFTLFKKEDLAIRSGLYDSYGDTSIHGHLLGYNSRTVSSNCMLVCKEDEIFNRNRAGTTVNNDCGQTSSIWTFGNSPTVEQWKDTPGYNSADITLFHDSPDFTYVAANLAGGYSPDKISAFMRHLVYLRPDANQQEFLVVFDRVKSVSAAYPKKWLLHFLNEPAVTGTESQISMGESLFAGPVTKADAGEARVFNKSLLPLAHQIRKIGGRIKGTVSEVSPASIKTSSANYVPNALVGNTLSFTDSYSLFNRQYRITSNTADTIAVDTTGLPDFVTLGVVPGRAYSAGKDYWVGDRNYPATQTDFESDYGSYRIELEPKFSAENDRFLNVLYPTTTATAEMPETVLVEAETMGGALIKTAAPRVVLFPKGAETVTSVIYRTEHASNAKHLVVGLAEGTYTVRLDGSVIHTGLAPSAQKTLSFQAASGLISINQDGEMPVLKKPAAPTGVQFK